MKVEIKRKDPYKYHDWFAWYPVEAYMKGQEPEMAEGKIYLVWLETIERMRMCDREFVWWFKRIK